MEIFKIEVTLSTKMPTEDFGYGKPINSMQQGCALLRLKREPHAKPCVIKTVGEDSIEVNYDWERSEDAQTLSVPKEEVCAYYPLVTEGEHRGVIREIRQQMEELLSPIERAAYTLASPIVGYLPARFQRWTTGNNETTCELMSVNSMIFNFFAGVAGVTTLGLELMGYNVDPSMGNWMSFVGLGLGIDDAPRLFGYAMVKVLSADDPRPLPWSGTVPFLVDEALDASGTYGKMIRTVERVQRSPLYQSIQKLLP